MVVSSGRASEETTKPRTLARGLGWVDSCQRAGTFSGVVVRAASFMAER
jgi:hypothetical protein